MVEGNKEHKSKSSFDQALRPAHCTRRWRAIARFTSRDIEPFGSLSASLLASHEPPLAQRKSARFSQIEFVHTSGTKVSQNFIQPKRDHVWNVSRAKR